MHRCHTLRSAIIVVSSLLLAAHSAVASSVAKPPSGFRHAKQSPHFPVSNSSDGSSSAGAQCGGGCMSTTCPESCPCINVHGAPMCWGRVPPPPSGGSSSSGSSGPICGASCRIDTDCPPGCPVCRLAGDGRSCQSRPPAPPYPTGGNHSGSGSEQCGGACGPNGECPESCPCVTVEGTEMCWGH